LYAFRGIDPNHSKTIKRKSEQRASQRRNQMKSAKVSKPLLNSNSIWSIEGSMVSGYSAEDSEEGAKFNIFIYIFKQFSLQLIQSCLYIEDEDFVFKALQTNSKSNELVAKANAEAARIQDKVGKFSALQVLLQAYPIGTKQHTKCLKEIANLYNVNLSDSDA
jgi:hypothetical protein